MNSAEPIGIEPSRTPRGGLLGVLLWPFRVLKGLYAWVVRWADHPWGAVALGVLSFAEASCFPIPPDPLLLALCFGRRKRSLWFGLLCTATSVLGGIAGWYIGRELFESVAVDVIRGVGAGPSWFGNEASAHALSAAEIEALPRAGEVIFYPDGLFYIVRRKFTENAFLAYFSAALSPIPYKVFTIAGGVFAVSLEMLVLGSVVGRGMRFMGLSVLIHFFGDRIKPFIERYFELLTIALVLLGVGGVLAVKYLA